MEGASAVADAPADLEAKRREVEEAAAGEPTEGAESTEPEGEASTEAAEAGASEEEGEAPGEGEGEQAAPPLAVQGSGSLNLQPGGQQPDKGTIKMRSKSIELVGQTQLKKGEVTNLLIKVRVDEIHFVDSHDSSTGDITQVERRHIVRPIGVEKVQ